jgi:NAD(P)-dependent dehydrogenase (short-subunit alcohol dehydrogenase family)
MRGQGEIWVTGHRSHSRWRRLPPAIYGRPAMVKAIVTGAARGIGAAIADRLAADGGAVAYVDVIEEVTDTAERARSRGAQAIARTVDVSDEQAVDVLVPGVAAEFGGLNVLVNCAGVGGVTAPVVELAVDAFRSTIDVNLVGAFLMARAFARQLDRSGPGSGERERDEDGNGNRAIVNIGSLFGQQGVANDAAYCASKGAIATFTHTLAHELGPAGIRVNTVAPGFIEVGMHLEWLQDVAHRHAGTVDDEISAERETVPLRRLGTPQDIAGAVAWLVSPDSSYVTGQTLAVNGGVLMS